MKRWLPTLVVVAICTAVTARRSTPADGRMKHLSEVSIRWLHETVSVLDEATDTVDPANCASINEVIQQLNEQATALEAQRDELVAAMNAAEILEQEEAAAAAQETVNAAMRKIERESARRTQHLRAFQEACPKEGEVLRRRFSEFHAKYIEAIKASRKHRELVVEAGRIGCMHFIAPPELAAQPLDLDGGIRGWRLVSPTRDPAFPDQRQELQVSGLLLKLGTTLEQVTEKQVARWEQQRLRRNARLADAGRPEDTPVKMSQFFFDGGVAARLYEGSMRHPADGRWRTRLRILFATHHSTLYMVDAIYAGPADGGHPFDATTDALFSSVWFDCADVKTR